MDDRLRFAERALAATPDDQAALSAVRVERARSGLCPECRQRQLSTERSGLLLDGCAVCWTCYLELGVPMLEKIALEDASRQIGCEIMENWRDVIQVGVSYAIRRVLKGRWPAVCSPGSPELAKHSRWPCSVFSTERPSDLRLYPVAVANARKGSDLVVVGVGFDTEAPGSDRLHAVWPELEPKQAMHGDAYRVAHGRPVMEKSLKERLAEWSKDEHRLDGPSAAACRLVAPKAAWAAWRKARVEKTEAIFSDAEREARAIVDSRRGGGLPFGRLNRVYSGRRPTP